MPAVSILVPTYNRAGLLQECLDSLLTTTVPCEILVSDNGSTDGTEALMATYTDPRITYVRHAGNGGGFFNYNFLLQRAANEYICLFGDDDIALPGCFEKKLAILDNDPTVAGVYSMLRIMDGAGNLAPGTTVNGVPECSHLRGRDEFAHLLINCCLSWQTLVFRRELRDRHGVLKDPTLYASDWDYLIEISYHRHFAFLKEPTVGVRLHTGSHGNKVAREAGHLAKDMVHIWRKWLLESEMCPVITDMAWQRMALMLESGVRSCYGQDQARMAAFNRHFASLRQDYAARMTGTFYAGFPTDSPLRAALDANGLPIFRRGVAPLALDTVKRLQFFHHPTWASDTWERVLEVYLSAFSAEDDVELVFWHDADQGVSLDEVATRIAAVCQRLDVDPERGPDIQLLTEPLDLSGLASLYAAVHAVIPGGDPVQVTRGTQIGTPVMTRLDVDVWRRLATRLLGRPLT
ncbi:MAG: glycosyltransferase [Candidatus Sericytochromatia bacterium]|nr:glycosyltransferase [Candidatus Sericytochromatia bacterium]